MTLIHKLCARLRHPFRRPLSCEVHLGNTVGCTRYYICRVCGEVVREDTT